VNDATPAATKNATMTKADIVERIYEKVGFSKKEASEVVESIFEIIKSRLEHGDKVTSETSS
jgi:nucleoid DNA-binding protein